MSQSGVAAPVDASAAVRAAEAAYLTLRGEKLCKGMLGVVLVGVAFLASAVLAELDPAKFLQGLPRIGEYMERTLPVLRWGQLPEDFSFWFWDIGNWLRLLAETVVMAYLATLLGTLGALLGCFFAARSLAPSPAIAFVVRRVFEFARAVPELVFALLFIFAFGLGPMAGVLAVALHSLGAQGKLFAEAAEAARHNTVEGVRSSGGNWMQTMRYAVLPQIMPNLVSFTLWRFEINVRNSAIIGFVGAGGIGEALFTAVRLLHYEDVSALLILLVVTVSLIDQLCAKIRHGLIR